MKQPQQVQEAAAAEEEEEEEELAPPEGVEPEGAAALPEIQVDLEPIPEEEEEEEEPLQAAPPPPPPPVPVIVLPPIDPLEAAAAAVEGPGGDALEEIEVDNPEPRPSESYVPFPTGYLNYCGPVPETFPRECFIVVKEGVPRDWIFERGFLALAGMLTSTAAPESKITLKKENPIYIRNYFALDSLNLEFVDTSFATFKIPAGQPEGFLCLLISVTDISR